MRSKRSYRSIYSSNYRRRGASPFKVIAAIIIIAALVFLGYSIGEPFVNWINGRLKLPVPSSSSAAAKTSSGAAAKKASSKPAAVSVKVRGVYLPKNYLSDTSALNSFITKAKAAGINLAVIDLKAEDGIVNYSTSVSQAKGTDIVASDAPDAGAAAKALAAAGITPAARICAFNDPVAPSVIRGSGVMYKGNHSYNWLDPQNKRWLNPNSPLAQQYIESLCTEAVSLGYKEIFIDSLTFPTSGNSDSTGYFGDMTSKESVLQNFVTELKGKIDATGAKLSVVSPGTQAIGAPLANIGQSQSVFALGGDFEAPNLCPSLFDKDGITVGSATLTKPDLTPGNTVSAVAQYLKTQGGDKVSTLVPFIQDFTNSELGDGDYKQYTASDVKSEISALQNAGISSYVLYNPQGTYDFDAVK